ncbi:unnamed protein product [Ilex paraguariensis]
MPNGGNCKCNCFLKGNVSPSCDMLWRPRAEISLSVSLPGKQRRKYFVWNSWTRSYKRRQPAHMLGFWMGETWLTTRPLISATSRDEDKILECFHSDSLVHKQVLTDLAVKGIICSDKNAAFVKCSHSRRTSLESEQPLEDPWLLLQSAPFSEYFAQSNASRGLTDEDEIVKCINSVLEPKPLNEFMFEVVSSSADTVATINKSSDLSRTSSQSDHPVEEPWLFQSSLLFFESNMNVGYDLSENEGPVKDEALHHDQNQQVPEKLLPDEESNAVSQDSVSTVILINSSICTMQRIAVLEDEQLVELLLEPVKNNVQCDNVYLGVVTKLVPHMGGAFVNIGSPRSSLMDVKSNREPFMFPPFCHRTKERKVNGAVSLKLQEHQGMTEYEHNSNDADIVDETGEHEIEDDLVQYLHNGFEEHEIDDDFDDPEVLKENVNGRVAFYRDEAGFDRDLDQLSGSVHHPDSHVVNKFLPVETGCAHDSQPSHLQDMKDGNGAYTDESKWAQVRKGTKIIVQVVKEGLGTKGPTLTAYPKLRSRFWILMTCYNRIGISKKISGVERTRLRVIANTLQPQGFGLTVRTVAAGHSLEELRKDLEGLLSTWKAIMEHAKSAALAADEGIEGAVPVLLHRAMGQTLSVVQDYFSDKVKSMVVDSPRTYHEVTNYLLEIAPDLCDRVELYGKRTPLFDEYNVEEEINNIISKRSHYKHFMVVMQTSQHTSFHLVCNRYSLYYFNFAPSLLLFPIQPQLPHLDGLLHEPVW